MNEKLINWLLEGDVSIQYQVNRDLLSVNKPSLQNKIAKEGWGAAFLSKRNKNGHWGEKFYQPKWTSSHYTLLDLRNLCITPDNKIIHKTIDIIIENEKGSDGGVLPTGKNQVTDICVDGMFLNYASYFKTDQEKLKSVIDCIISQIMPDGGFNCRLNRGGAVHSSLHSTISVLEGITEYYKNGYTYRIDELMKLQKSATEFILQHQLFISDRTGDIINKEFLKLCYPHRWKYNILRAMDYFQYAEVKWDDRMKAAMEEIKKKRNKDQTWNVQARHPGQLHFEMEKAGKASRWNTLRCLRIYKFYSFS